MTSKDMLYEKFRHAHRLHPAAMLFSFIATIKETILGFGIGLIITLKESVFYFLLFAGIFIVFLFVYSLLSWWRFIYYVEDGELRIEQGVFIRKKRYISINRIHKIDLTANLIHRLFKLVNVQIDTASNSDAAEVSLTAIDAEEAAQLRQLLQKPAQEQLDENVEISRPVAKITWKRLFIAGSTSGSAGVIVIAGLTLFAQIEEFIPRRVFNSLFDWFVSAGFILFIMLIVFLAILLWIFGIAGTMIRYGNFTIEKGQEELFIKRGLIETKELTIPFERIQAIGIEQSPIRQPFGYVRVFAVVAGGSFDRLESFPIIFPLLHQREVVAFLDKFLPNYDLTAVTDLKPLPKRSFLFYMAASLIWPILILIPILYFFPSFYWLAIILWILSAILNGLRYKDAAFAIDGDLFLIQKRRLQKVRILTSKRSIQSLEVRVQPIQRMRKLSSLQISLIGSQGLGTHYQLDHLDEEDAKEIASWYSYRQQEQDQE